MSTSWSTPDPRRALPGPLAPSVLPQAGPSVREDGAAGLLAAVVTVLVGAPVGLLWAAVAPKVVVVLAAGQQARLADPGTDAFIAGDGFFLMAVVLAGVVGGLLAWRLGRAHGPAVVVGLAVGGLAAAWVAMRVGTTVGAAEVQQAVQAGQQGALELSLRLRAQEALVGWPVGALLAYVGASSVRGR